jgi:hypothetical protein
MAVTWSSLTLFDLPSALLCQRPRAIASRMMIIALLTLVLSPLAQATVYFNSQSGHALVVTTGEDHVAMEENSFGIDILGPATPVVEAFRCSVQKSEELAQLEPQHDRRNCRYVAEIYDQELSWTVPRLRNYAQLGNLSEYEGKSLSISQFERLQAEISMNQVSAAFKDLLSSKSPHEIFTFYQQTIATQVVEASEEEMDAKINEFKLLSANSLAIGNVHPDSESRRTYDFTKFEERLKTQRLALQMRLVFSVQDCTVDVIAGDFLVNDLDQGEVGQISASLAVEPLGLKPDCKTPAPRDLSSEWMDIEIGSRQMDLSYPEGARVELRNSHWIAR